MLVEIAADFSKVVSRRTFVDRSTGGKYMCEAVIGKNNGSYTIIDKSIWEAKKFEIDLEKYEPPDTIRTYYTYTLELARDSLKFYTPEELDSMGTQKNFKNILGKLSRLDEYYGYEEVPAGIKYTVKMTDIEPKNGIHTLELFGEQQDLLPKDLDKLKNRTKYEITVISDDELIKKDFFALYYYLIPYSEEVPLPQMEKH
jgi:hypothetical protein